MAYARGHVDAETRAVTNLIHGLLGISRPTTPIQSAILEAPRTLRSGGIGRAVSEKLMLAATTTSNTTQPAS